MRTTRTKSDLYWTKTRSQEIVDRASAEAEIRKRISGTSAVAGLGALSAEEKERVLDETIRDDRWARWHNGETLGSIVRQAKDVALDVALARR